MAACFTTMVKLKVLRTPGWCIVAALGSLLLHAALAAAADDAESKPPSGKASRDLTGVWMNDNTLDETLKREGRHRATAADFERPRSTIQLTPEYQAILDEKRRAKAARAVGAEACKWPGLTGMMTYPYPFEILQTPGRITLLFEAESQVRRIFLRNKHLDPDDLDPSYYGDSIGRWEGDVLLVDTIGFNTDTEVQGMPHSEDMHITERIHFIKPNTIEDELTVIDPKAFVKPFVEKLVYSRRPGWRIREYSCEENNRDAPDAGGKRSQGAVKE
jgi:hypothetical protein